MEKFYVDNEAAERFKQYAGKTMLEISELEQKEFDSKQLEIDAAHSKFAGNRAKMLTVQKLIDFLKTQDPNGCILAYELNSDAYIEQLPDLPSPDIMNVADAKKQMKKDLEIWYRSTDSAEEKVQQCIKTVFRYAKDSDVIIRFQ